VQQTDEAVDGQHLGRPPPRREAVVQDGRSRHDAVVSIATAGVAPQEAGMASGLLNSSRQIGASLGLAALGGLPVAPAALNSGYAVVLTTSTILLLGAAAIVLRRRARAATAGRVPVAMAMAMAMADRSAVKS
jgi:hypothetical protein